MSVDKQQSFSQLQTMRNLGVSWIYSRSVYHVSYIHLGTNYYLTNWSSNYSFFDLRNYDREM